MPGLRRTVGRPGAYRAHVALPLHSFLSLTLSRHCTVSRESATKVTKRVLLCSFSREKGLVLSARCTLRAMCDHCGAPMAAGRPLLRCERCRWARYCSQYCQRADWPWHRRECYPAPETLLPVRRWIFTMCRKLARRRRRWAKGFRKGLRAAGRIASEAVPQLRFRVRLTAWCCFLCMAGEHWRPRTRPPIPLPDGPI